MKSFIFITEEGSTYQPDSYLGEPDIDNCQVIGFAQGIDERDAFTNIVKENEYLLETTFDEVICMELKHSDHYKHAKYFSLAHMRISNNVDDKTTAEERSL